AHLTIDHFLARDRKTGHLWTCNRRSGRAAETDGNRAHLWYKGLQNATCRFARPQRSTPPTVEVYSMVTASRPISRATSSKRSESGAAMARASRSRHSSSLRAGKSGATIEGERLMRSTGMTSGIRITSEGYPAHTAFSAIGTIWRRPRTTDGGSAWGAG